MPSARRKVTTLRFDRSSGAARMSDVLRLAAFLARTGKFRISINGPKVTETKKGVNIHDG